MAAARWVLPLRAHQTGRFRAPLVKFPVKQKSIANPPIRISSVVPIAELDASYITVDSKRPGTFFLKGEHDNRNKIDPMSRHTEQENLRQMSLIWLPFGVGQID